MDIRKYELLLKIKELGSLTGAANVMHYTQPGVSYTLNEIEREWDTVLFSRGKNGVVLTKEGTHLMPFIRDVCEANKRLVDELAALRGIERGSVSIGTFTSISVHILPSILKQYQTEHPNVEIKLLHGNYNEIEEWIREGIVDIGFLEHPTGTNVQTIPFGQDRLVAILPVGHELSSYERFPTISLIDQPYIGAECGVDNEIAEVFQKNGMPLNVKLTVKDDFETLAMVESGLGISILPELLLYRTHFQIVARELDYPLTRKICVAFQGLDTLSHAAKQFLQTIFSSHWDWEGQAPFTRVEHVRQKINF